MHPSVVHEERITIQELAHMKSGDRKRNASFEQSQLLDGDELLPSVLTLSTETTKTFTA